MFCEKPNRFIPNAQIEIIREIDGTDKMERRTFDGPVWLQAKQVVRYFEEVILRSYTLRYADRMEHKIIYNYPITAFEELATNAILHKEYDINEYVGIYIYKNHISFVNHNRPLPPITIKALNNDRSFDKRQYLNKELKDMFFSLDLIESYGSGIRRAKDALDENESPKIIFLPDNDIDNYTNAIIQIQPEFLKKNFFNSTSKETSKETTEDLILKIMKKNPTYTAVQIAESIEGITPAGVRYHIGKLKSKNKIKRIGSTKSGS